MQIINGKYLSHLYWGKRISNYSLWHCSEKIQMKIVGIELFVLDDGWLGNRNDDTSSLDDWYENKQKLPNGLIGLEQKIHSMGMKFGL